MTLLILFSIPSGCRLKSRRGNSVKQNRMKVKTQNRRGDLAAMKLQLARCEAEITATNDSLAEVQKRLDGMLGKRDVETAKLSEKLRVLKALEEDQAAVDKRLAELQGRRREVKGQQRILADLSAQLTSINSSIATTRAEVDKRTAELRNVQTRLKALVDMQASVKATLDGTNDPKKQPAPAKKAPTKKAPSKRAIRD